MNGQSVKSTVQTEALSEKLLKGKHLSDSKTKTKVDTIRNKFKLKKSIRKAKVVKSDSESESNDKFKSCTKCGLKHPPNKCLAYGEACYKCGHFLRMCGKLAKKGHTMFTKRSVADMELTDEDSLNAFEYS